MKDVETKLFLPEILGIPKKGIIFTDLDGVWFDEDANFASPTNTQAIEDAKNAGYWVVLNSDTAVQSLAEFSKELGCSPLVIGENGAVIYVANQKVKEYLSPAKDFFDRVKSNAINSFLMETPDASFFIGDATPILRTNPSFPTSSTKAYMINTARECSFGIYTREVNQNGVPVVNDNLTRQTYNKLSGLLANLNADDNIICNEYPNLGSCLVKDTNTAKWKAIKWVINQLPSNLSYYMIGDRIADSTETLVDRVTTCAVGNASDELKSSVLRTGGVQAPNNFSIADGASFVIKQILMKG